MATYDEWRLGGTRPNLAQRVYDEDYAKRQQQKMMNHSMAHQLAKIRNPIPNRLLNQEDMFMRFSWLVGGKEDLRFMYDRMVGNFCYLNNATVGLQVMCADDIIVVTGMTDKQIKRKYLNIEGDEMASKNKNYIGQYETIARVIYDLSDESGPEISVYNYKMSLKNVEEGDFVIVDGRNGMDIVKVIEVVQRSLETKAIKEFNKAKAWVVCKVDMLQHNQRKEATERKEFIMKQLAERKEQMEEVAIYKMLAETDKEAAKLLEELEGLK